MVMQNLGILIVVRDCFRAVGTRFRQASLVLVALFLELDERVGFNFSLCAFVVVALLLELGERLGS